ncbi:MAG: MFS family permease [Pirellulaceae bacterium]|jgi:MFS family permease
MDNTPLAENTDPQEPRRRYRYFPGYTMVGISAAAQFMSAPGQSYSVAAFKEPMREALAISETNYALAYGFATIVSGLSLPIVGRMIDRFGARRMLPAIAFFLGLACLGMSQVTSLTSLYFGFSFVRSLGQGALSLVAAWMVGEWFARRRGFATAISGLGGSISVMCIPLINIYVINHFGWEMGWTVLGIAVWVVLLLPSSFLVRDRPEDLGLLPDGDSGIDSSESGVSLDDSAVSKVRSNSDWTVAAVMRDPTFWKLLAVPATSGMVGTGLVFHCVLLLGSRGVPPGWALALISFQAAVATSAALFAGYLTDRWQARYLLSTAMLFLAGAGTIILLMPHPLVAIFYAVLLGLHGSIIRSTGMVVWMNYYGREHQGAIRGIAMAVMILAAAAGPLPLAISIEWLKSYDFAIYIFIATPLVSSILVWTAKPPRVAKKIVNRMA